MLMINIAKKVKSLIMINICHEKNILVDRRWCVDVQSGLKCIHFVAIEDDASSLPAPTLDVVFKAVNSLEGRPLGDGSGRGNGARRRLASGFSLISIGHDV